MATIGADGLDWPTWIGIVCDDLEAQREFYRGVLGARETEVGDGWVHFAFGGRLLELIQRDPSPQYERARFQVGFTVGDLEAARQRLIEAGAEQISGIEGEPDSPNHWCYFRDPEGNVFEVTQWLDR
jgi:catechol 2,3-dioxygenase-like lactoylglutathione lyase family enzyme